MDGVVGEGEVGLEVGGDGDVVVNLFIDVEVWVGVFVGFDCVEEMFVVEVVLGDCV